MKITQIESVGEHVAKLIQVYHGMEDLTGMILATLALNKNAFFPDDAPAQAAFNELLTRWRKRYGEITE